MPDESRAQEDQIAGRMASKPQLPPPSPWAADSLQEIADITGRLALHGRAVSLDLAFDLVLHDIVKEARAASGATGAAIALARDGQMVCRATSGENAPDLGVTVEPGSGLTGTCLRTGAIQQCQDTESDSRVEPETCRRLGVRSMLLIPLVDDDRTFGVLQLFSSYPNTFGDREIVTLLPLAGRVTENRRMMLQSARPAATSTDMQLFLAERLRPKNRTDLVPAPEDLFLSESVMDKANEIWTTILFVLVIVAAISLGIAVGWSNGKKAATAPRVLRRASATSAETPQVSTRSPVQDIVSASQSSVDPSSKIDGETKSVAVPPGGLLVTENGRVIFRSPQEPARHDLKQPASKPIPRELVRRVEPDYPLKARSERIQGAVVLDLKIAGDGSVTNAAVVSGNPVLASAAVQAVRQWQYEPARGASRARVTLQFTLPTN